MSLFRPAGRERRAWGDSLADVLELARGGPVAAGVPVTDESALRLGAVWGCVDLIAELVSTLPMDEFRRVANAERIELPPSALLDDPAGDGYGFEVWCRQLMTSLLMRGNGFGWVEQIGGDGWPTQIASVHPDEIGARRRLKSGPVEWSRDNKPVERWPLGPLWHLPAYVVPGSPIGMSPIRYAAETIGVGLAAHKYGAKWFNGGGLPSSVLESDQVVDKDTGQAIKDRVVESMKGDGPLTLGAGFKWRAIQISPDESQFLETMKANADDVARFFFRRPPGEGGQVTYANVEARSLDLLTYTLNGWLVRVERALSRLRPRPRYVKFNPDALVRVDLITRYKAHDIAIRSGLDSRDERRALEDRPPIPDGTGGEHLWPPYSTTLSPEGGSDDRFAEPA